MKSVQRYINLYLHKIATQNAPWQRYTSSHLFLGGGSKARTYLLANAMQGW
jgi:hypothetical protein